jgi:magnesium transporter
MATALLFERDAVEELDTWDETIPRLGRSSVLWIDLESPDRTEIEHLGDALDLAAGTRDRLSDPRPNGPHFSGGERYVHVTAYAPSEERRLVRIECLVSKRWVVTVRDRQLEVLETFRERASGSGQTGRLEGLEFLADLLEWVVGSYFGAFEQIEVELEDVDTAAMSGDIESRDEVLARLVEVRREIGRLRRALTSHREAILALTRPELEAMSNSRSAERFSALRERLEEAAQAARDSRESVVGSFDVLIATTGQRTNEIMKVLTLASVLLLPGALLAGIMGMNFQLGLFEHTELFWVIIAVMFVVAIVTVGVARMRDWI